MEKKKILTLMILIIILIGIGSFQFNRPKNQKNKKVSQPIKTLDLDLNTIEKRHSELKEKFRKFESYSSNQFLSEPKIFKNPLNPYIKKKEVLIKDEEILIKLEKPNFKISGIVYDKKPYVIIENEVKTEGNEISGFTIKKIYPEKIIVSDKYGNFFTLNFDYEKGENK